MVITSSFFAWSGQVQLEGVRWHPYIYTMRFAATLAGGYLLAILFSGCEGTAGTCTEPSGCRAITCTGLDCNDAGISDDAGVDAGINEDAGVDAGRDDDAGVDAGMEVDAGIDAGISDDAGVDAGMEVDAGLDAGPGIVTGGGENCADPFVVPSGSWNFDASIADAGNDITFVDVGLCEGSSAFSSTGGDHIYRVAVQPGERVVAGLNSPNFDHILNFLDGLLGCGLPNPDGGPGTIDVSCLAGIDSPEPSVLKYTNDTSATKDVYVVVDTYSGAGSEYALSLHSGPIPLGDECSNPEPLMTGTQLNAQNLAIDSSFGADYWTASSCPYRSGIERTYQFTVPAGSVARVTVTPSPGFNPTLSLVANATDCVAGECLAKSEGTMGQPHTLAYRNLDLANAKPVILIVDANFTLNGTYSLLATVEPIDTGDTCEVAATAPPSVSDTLLYAFADYQSGPGCVSGSNGPDTAWLTTVPPGNRLTATLAVSSADGGAVPEFRPRLHLVKDTCAATLSCVASAGATATSISTTYDNLSSVDESIAMIVDTPDSAPLGTYTLSSTVAPSVFLPGDTCSSVAAPIVTDTALNGESSVGYSSHWNTATLETNCTFLDGPDKVYQVTLPPGWQLSTTATSTDDVALSAVIGTAADCIASPVTCTLSQDATSSGEETLRHNNTTTSTQTVFVIVDRRVSSTPSNVFDIHFSLTPVTAGTESCDTASPLGAQTSIASSTVGMTDNYNIASANGCISGNTGSTAPDAVWTVTVPPQSTTTISAVASWRLSLNVVSSPSSNCGGTLGAGMMCLGSMGRGPGLLNSVGLSNTTDVGLPVYAVIDGYDTTDFGPYEMHTSTVALPYSVSRIPTACTDMSTGTAVPAAVGDDAVSGVLALPFTFEYFHSPVTHASVCSNGFAQLWPTATGTPQSSASNGSFPTSSTPNNMVAPLWDDLTSVGGSTVKTLTTGTTPNRVFTIEWGQFTYFGGTQLERLTFQIQLRETLNTVEYHYCQLALNGGDAERLSGRYASVGLEDATGTQGVTISVDKANAFSTTEAFRLTP